MNDTLRSLERAAIEIRRNLLWLCTKQVIHIGGDLSCTDMMTALWQYKMRYDPMNVKWEHRDRFVLSKGHASAVLSMNQAAIGCFAAEDVLNEYATDSGRFTMHSCALVNPYVEVSTGSLGHGLPIACGIAAALKLKGNTDSRVYTLMGDGEQSEGSIWEAVMNASHYELGNLVAILDFNGLEADGTINQITGLGDIGGKYRCFGWNVIEIDGNDMKEVLKAFDEIPSAGSNQPTIIIGHTIKGKGVPFMENNARWHAGKITEEQFHTCVDEMEAKFLSKWNANGGAYHE